MHFYDGPDGTKIPSVTTILKIMVAEELLHWSNWLGFKHIKYEDELDRTSNIGTNIHRGVQLIVDPNSAEPMVYQNSFDRAYYEDIFNRFRIFISQFSYETVFTEKTLVSPELGFGGTLDWYAKIGGFMLLCDFKSSKDVRLKHMLQLGGYYSLLKSQGYTVNGGSIIIVNNKTCKMYPVREPVLQEMADVFSHLVYIYKELNGGKYLPKADHQFLEELKKKLPEQVAV